jgi:hypothetical protein
MHPLSCVETLVLLSTIACAQAPAVGDYTKLARQGDYVVRDFKFHTGETLGELRKHRLVGDNPSRALESALFLGNTGAGRTIIVGI